MKGVENFFDAKGEPKAALIDLRKHPELWEEFRDTMLANEGEVPPEGFARVHSPVPKKGEKSKGLEYLYDKEGKPKAVLINLRKYGELWEDFHDLLYIRKHRNEPRETLEEVKEALLKKRKIGANK